MCKIKYLGKKMKSLFCILIFFTTTLLFSQGVTKGDANASTSNVIKRIDGSITNTWNKSYNETSAPVNTTNDAVSFSSNSEGIYVTILNGTNKIKLFALTGQLLLNGDLTQGRFFIPTRKGIYFLRINNKSYKVICK